MFAVAEKLKRVAVAKQKLFFAKEKMFSIKSLCKCTMEQ
jgi:hypothetical protein